MSIVDLVWIDSGTGHLGSGDLKSYTEILIAQRPPSMNNWRTSPNDFREFIVFILAGNKPNRCLNNSIINIKLSDTNYS